jgi:hypothetical protein
VDHIAYTITNWDAEEDGLEEELKRRNLQYTGSVKTSFQVKDPEGMGVQFGGLPELTRRPSKVSAGQKEMPMPIQVRSRPGKRPRRSLRPNSSANRPSNAPIDRLRDHTDTPDRQHNTACNTARAAVAPI